MTLARKQRQTANAGRGMLAVEAQEYLATNEPAIGDEGKSVIAAVRAEAGEHAANDDRIGALTADASEMFDLRTVADLEDEDPVLLIGTDLDGIDDLEQRQFRACADAHERAVEGGVHRPGRHDGEDDQGLGNMRCRARRRRQRRPA